MIAERVITVEYLYPSMSRDLLCKFPDDSAFDFDYVQSGIWSPLLPRGRRSSDGSSAIFSPENLRKVKGSMMMKKKKKTKIKKNLPTKSLIFSPTPVKRGWRRVLKAASKQFKAHRRSALQMMLPTL